MIVDTVENIGRYASLSANLARGLGFLQESLRTTIPDGKHAILGDQVYASVSTYLTQPMAEKQFEAHEKYIDIQYLLQGEEALFWAPRPTLDLDTPDAESEDIAFFTGATGLEIPLTPAVFVVLFPWDGHKPGCILHTPQQVKKLVIKVSVR